MAYGVRICCLVDGEGQSKDGRWRWEFHEYLGPTFVTKEGKMRKCPGERHPVWREFAAWLKEYDAAKKLKRCCSPVDGETKPVPQRDVEEYGYGNVSAKCPGCGCTKVCECVPQKGDV